MGALGDKEKELPVSESNDSVLAETQCVQRNVEMVAAVSIVQTYQHFGIKMVRHACEYVIEVGEEPCHPDRDAHPSCFTPSVDGFVPPTVANLYVTVDCDGHDVQDGGHAQGNGDHARHYTHRFVGVVEITSSKYACKQKAGDGKNREPYTVTVHHVANLLRC